MKITVYTINAKLRRQLLKDGWISRPPMTFIYDNIGLVDFLQANVEALQNDPTYNVRGAIQTAFGKCRRYYLVDNFRRLFGLQREADNAFEMDITDIFVDTLEAQIRAHDTTENHLIDALVNKVEETEEYKAAALQLNVWGY